MIILWRFIISNKVAESENHAKQKNSTQKWEGKAYGDRNQNRGCL